MARFNLKYGFKESEKIVEKLLESYKNNEEDYIMENKIEDIHKVVEKSKVVRKRQLQEKKWKLCSQI